jgi:hypothetical protein
VCCDRRGGGGCVRCGGQHQDAAYVTDSLTVTLELPHTFSIVESLCSFNLCAPTCYAFSDATSLATARVTLNGGLYTAIPAADGTFSFQGVLPGVYYLEVHHTVFLFDNVRLEVGAKGVKAAPTNKRERLPYPLQLRPLVEAQYFQPRENFALGSLLSNPMALFLLFGGFMSTSV